MNTQDLTKCHCSLCGGGYSLPAELVGRTMECPHCHERARFAVPADEPPPMVDAPPVQVGGEQTFFNDSGIAVTKTRFVAGAQTFAMSGITSVRVAESQPGLGVGAVLIAVGCFIGLAAFASGSVITAALTLGFASLFVVGGITVERAKRTIYHVVLSTSGGEVKAYSSQDRGFVIKLTAALNHAIIARG